MDLKMFLKHNVSIQLSQRQIVSETTADLSRIAAGYTALSNINVVAGKYQQIFSKALGSVISVAPIDFIVNIPENGLHKPCTT